jgi:very-long-chain (3R)-3-hydroxyacyl-CoA dehydratase
MSTTIKKYLKAYNLVQLIGWFLALLIVPINIFISFIIICIVQLLSLLEVFHAYKKWSNSSVLFCFLQIGARLMILQIASFLYFSQTNFSPINFFTKENLEIVLHIMLIIWSIAEIIRYGFYVSIFCNVKSNKFLWLRYHAFIVCYPVGVICEIYLLLNVFLVSTTIPKIFIVLVFIVYAIAFPVLYLHLLKQRKKKLMISNTPTIIGGFDS